MSILSKVSSAVLPAVQWGEMLDQSPHQAHELSDALGFRDTDVTLSHAPAGVDETLHVYVDGEYFRAFALVKDSTHTFVRVCADAWRTAGEVHAIDVYKASATGRVLDHQTMLVTAARGEHTFGARSHCLQGEAEWSAALQAEVDAVEYRVSREGLPFGAWHADYQEPAGDGRDDGNYVVQMRMLDAERRVLDVHTISFLVRDGLVIES